jgi:HlyD family secretion protein
MRRWQWIAVVVAALTVAAGAWWRLHAKVDVRVTTATVTSGPIVRHVVATGALHSRTTVDVGTQVSGTVQSLNADFNSLVRSGQVLAQLDPALFNAAVQQAEASLAQARANLTALQVAATDAETKLARAEALARDELIPQSDLDAARIAVDAANAEVRSGTSQVTQSTAALTSARINLDYTTIRSPIDGIVVGRNVDVGQTVAATLQSPVLFTVSANLQQMQVWADLDEADIAGVHAGEHVTFEVESYRDQQFEGVVSEVRLQPTVQQTAAVTQAGAPATPASPASTSTVATVISYTTVIDVINPGGRLKPGMTATVELDGATRDQAMRLPTAALSFRPSAEILNAIDEPEQRADRAANESAAVGRPAQVWQYDGHRFVPIRVTCGLADQSWTELLSGPLQAGAAVVTNAEIVKR